MREVTRWKEIDGPCSGSWCLGGVFREVGGFGCLFQDEQGLESKEKRMLSDPEGAEGKPEGGRWKRLRLTCSLLDPAHSRGLLGITEYINIPE